MDELIKVTYEGNQEYRASGNTPSGRLVIQKYIANKTSQDSMDAMIDVWVKAMDCYSTSYITTEMVGTYGDAVFYRVRCAIN